MGCIKCHPHMCHCPPSKQERVDRLIDALAGGGWNGEERKIMRAELSKLLSVNEIINEIDEALFNSTYTGTEKERLRELATLIKRSDSLVKALKGANDEE